ncbi:chorismate mutase [Stutzerimonas urumqiensis]|uniref:chorismate mutase n=1 Tax=Stutzerimonas urumqiensis TaxID=638269 RepID=UPI003BAC7D4E
MDRSEPAPLCRDLDEVRAGIDALDERIVELLARREHLVKQAAAFKRDDSQVRAPARVEQVITKVVALAGQHNADTDVVERVYRAMIAAFIDRELIEHRRLTAD